MNDIEDILKATIQTKVVEAFNTTPDMIDKLVEAAISKDVNEYGQKPDRYGEKKMPYMEWLVGDEIRKAIKESVREYIESNSDEIGKKVSEALNSLDASKQMSSALSKILSEEYRWYVNLNIDRNES